MAQKPFSLPRVVLGVAVFAFVIGASSQVLALERQLAGIALFKPASVVLKKYGNPDRITIGSGSAAAAQSPYGSLYGPSSAPPGVTVPTEGMRPMPMRDVSPFAGLGPGALPGLSSVGGLPGLAPTWGAAQPGEAGSSDTVPDTDVRWTYYLPKKGPTLEFIIGDGIVSQITVSGTKWAGVKTAKGITLGDSYKKALLLYGYPDKHEYAGRFIRIGYLQRSNIMFTVRDNKTIVGITIGLKE